MKVAGPGIRKEFKPDECVKEGQRKGQMDRNYLLDLFLGLFVRLVFSEDLIREDRASLPAPHLHHVISELTCSNNWWRCRDLNPGHCESRGVQRDVSGRASVSPTSLWLSSEPSVKLCLPYREREKKGRAVDECNLSPLLFQSG